MSNYDMFGYRRIEKMNMGKATCNDPGEPPRMVMLRPAQIVINEEYQRSLSKASVAQIKRMAHEFDWRSYKALNVAPTDDPELFEAVDGQHTAIAALTNGRVPFLPCLLHDSKTLEDKASGFIGINTRRLALTPMAIFNAKVAAKDDDAILVEAAMSRAGVTLVEAPPTGIRGGKWKVGETMAIGSMMQIVRKDGDARLSTILRMAVLAEAAPISSALVKALDLCLPQDATLEQREAVVAVLKRQGISRLEVIGRSSSIPAYMEMADRIADSIGLARRAGIKRKKK